MSQRGSLKLSSAKSLINLFDKKDSQSPVKREIKRSQSENDYKIIGIDISRLWNEELISIPFLNECLEQLKKRGSKELGIFLISASQQEVITLQKYLEKIFFKIEPNILDKYSCRVIATFLLEFFENLPQPLIDPTIASELLFVASNNASLDKYKQILKFLKKENRIILQSLLATLSCLACSTENTLLNSVILAMKFGPILIKQKEEETNKFDSIFSKTPQNLQKNTVLFVLIENHSLLFSP